MGNLSDFLTKAKIGQPNPPAVSPSAAAVEVPQIVESVKAKESTTAIVHVPQTPGASLPVRTGSLSKLLSTPKPEPKSEVAPASLPTELTMDSENPLVIAMANLDVDNDVVYDPVALRNGFRETLDKLDNLMRDETRNIKQVTDFNIDTIRSFLKTIMIDWKANPDYSDLVIDDDYNNIMTFMWATQQRAIESNVQKAVKADKASTKSSKRAQIEVNLDLSDW